MKKFRIINIYTVTILFIIFIISFVSGFLFYKDDVLLKNRDFDSLKKALKQSRTDNPNGIGGAYLPEITSTPVSYLEYIVKSGDTIHSISDKLGIDEVTILNFNEISIPSMIPVGKKIVVPNQDGIIVKVSNKINLDDISKKYDFEKDELLEINNEKDESIIKSVFVPGLHTDSITKSLLLGEFFRKPTYGRITSYFGYRVDPWTRHKSYHQGVDIANRYGTRIKSAGPGQVIFTGWYWPLGYTVAIQHTSGYVTFYGHLDKILVNNYKWIAAGTTIALMGSSGRSTGSHLHFEVRRYGRVINPFKVTVF